MSIICEARQKGELVFELKRGGSVPFVQPGEWSESTRGYVQECLRLCLRWVAADRLRGLNSVSLAGLRIADARVRTRPLGSDDLDYAREHPGRYAIFLLDPAGRQYTMAVEVLPETASYRFFDPSFGEFAFTSFERLRQWLRGFLCLSNYAHRFTRGFAFVRIAVAKQRETVSHSQHTEAPAERPLVPRRLGTQSSSYRDREEGPRWTRRVRSAAANV